MLYLGLYGVGVYKSTGVQLADATIDATQKISMIPYGSPTGAVQVGDGIEVIGSDDLAFSSIRMNDNTRAGVVVDGRETAGGVTNVTFNDVEVDGVGDRGFVEQHGTASLAPDVVSETLIQADLLGGTLDVARQLDTEMVPAPDNIIEIDY